MVLDLICNLPRDNWYKRGIKDGKNALSRIDGQPILLQDLKKLLKVKQVFFQGAAGDKMIVQIGENEWEVAEQLVHESLKRLCGICQTERHKQILKQPKGGDDGGLLNVVPFPAQC